MQTEKTGIELAIDAAGSQELLAKSLGCTQQNISFWKTQGYVPLLRAVEIESITGVKRLELVDPRFVDVIAPDSF
jgi:DNA-binding transcriptional regulator YdaS (Cro superfamily)